VFDGELPGPVTLDTRANLPPLIDDTILHVSVMLQLKDVGFIVGYPTPTEASPWTDEPSRVGAAVPTGTCGGEAGADEACVPGGAFLLGLPLALAGADSSTTKRAGERVVLISPFYVDTTEVTGDAFAALLPKLGVPPPSGPGCTYVASRTLPLDCVTHESARAYCQAIGKDLPTEAQWEYLASGLGREWLYPWGDDTPTCTDVVAALLDGSSGGCWAGVQPPGKGRLDRVHLEKEVVDLAGNLSEHVRDDLAELLGPGGLLVDPVGTGPFSIVRGGRVGMAPEDSRATFRAQVSAPGTGVGFRCVRRP
jgi:formylglycine-generating enzyme required for sulfatase activity